MATNIFSRKHIGILIIVLFIFFLINVNVLFEIRINDIQSTDLVANLGDKDLQDVDELYILYLGFDVIVANFLSGNLIYKGTRSNFLWDTDLNRLNSIIRKESRSKRVLRAYEILIDLIYMLYTRDTQINAKLFVAPPVLFVPECISLQKSLSLKIKDKLIEYFLKYIKANNLLSKEYELIKNSISRNPCDFCYFLYSSIVLSSFKDRNTELLLLNETGSKNKLIRLENFKFSWSYLSSIASSNAFILLVQQSLDLDYLKHDSLEVTMASILLGEQIDHRHHYILQHGELNCVFFFKQTVVGSNPAVLDWRQFLIGSNEPEEMGSSITFIPFSSSVNLSIKYKSLRSILEAKFISPKFVCLPQTIIIGAQKGATGELGLWLDKHWRIKRYSNEVHFFDNISKKRIVDAFFGHISVLKHYISDTVNTTTIKPFKFKHRIYQQVNITRARSYVEKPPVTDIKLTYFRNLVKNKGADFLSLSRMLNATAMIDKTPSYFDKANPEDLVKTGIKNLVLILRNPIERLHSAFWHLCRNHPSRNCNKYEFRNWILTALKNIHQNSELVDLHAIRAVSYSLYYAYLEKWIKASCRNKDTKLIILFTEEFKQKPFDTMRFLHQQLNLEEFNYKEMATQTKNGLWVLSKHSKTITEQKPKNFVPLVDDIVLHDFLSKFYAKSIELLKDLLKNRNLVSYGNPKWIGTL